ncbi:serine hydrolase domain-containing protein [Bacteroidota bacterium]
MFEKRLKNETITLYLAGEMILNPDQYDTISTPDRTMKKYIQPGSKNVSLSLIILLIVLITASCDRSGSSDSLPRGTPEAEGISSGAIIAFLDAVEESRQELHSFMILRHGKVVAEGWWNPYKPELKHTLYSTSKSFTSTAIGFAVTENLLTVEDKVISFFPESIPDSVSKNLAAMRIKDLLTMSAGQDPEPTFSMLPSSNWVKDFLSAPVPNEPGSTFLYNLAATYMLSAIITKVTGNTVLEYLTPRLFEPLQIEGMDWEVDPDGINTGGWGLRLKTEDMAKFGQLYLQKGEWNGMQVISEAWVEEATTKKIDQAPDLSEEEKSNSDWQQGYCYKFWRSRHNSYRADGAYGQYILILPEKDAVIAITAEAGDMQKELNLVWDHLLPAMKDEALPPNKELQTRLEDRIASLVLEPPIGKEHPEKEAEISGSAFTFAEQEEYEKVSFKFSDGQCTMKQNIGDKNFHFVFGNGKWILGETEKRGTNLLAQPEKYIVDLMPFKVAGAYRWIEPNTLELTLRYIESPHSDHYTIIFEGESILMKYTNSRDRRESSPVLKGKKI